MQSEDSPGVVERWFLNPWRYTALATGIGILAALGDALDGGMSMDAFGLTAFGMVLLYLPAVWMVILIHRAFDRWEDDWWVYADE